MKTTNKSMKKWLTKQNMGLEASTLHLDKDVRSFSDLCNELAFRLWSAVASKGPASARSLVVSPFAVTSLLAMVFLGARGPTSGQMNDILRLDDMVTFNPHQVFRNVTESIVLANNPGVVTAAFVRELYSDKAKGKLLDFYKERAQQFYDGHVEEVDFSDIGDVVRRPDQPLGEETDFRKGARIPQRQPPHAKASPGGFQRQHLSASTEGRDGEMYFTLLPATRQRRLVPIPAVVWRDGFLAGYDPVLDATAISLGGADTTVSTVMVLPGQQGQLASLEERLVDSPYAEGAWSRLLQTLHPRSGLELQLPRFSHRSQVNVTSALRRMGLRDLFAQGRADLKGLNGLSNDLYLADMVTVVWRDGFLAGYDPVLDATAISLGGADTTVSTVMVLPGQQGQLASLEERLVDSPYAEGAWSRLLRTLHPRSGLELQLPRFSHRSQVNVTSALRRMGLRDLFAQGRADLKGLNGLSNDLYLADMVSVVLQALLVRLAVQVNTFSTCSEESRDSRRHVEVFPAATQRVGREEDDYDGELEGDEQDVASIPLALRPRQARVPEGPRLRFDRPFLYLVRHNPTGLILHMGRFNPRLLR
ncbi:unnamed protein product [Timema podura]|uniref:Serpin domain-containing protein n=1 Tax=Timema podura TaxID=61482 RepID=A0ABN7NLQ6_TIMPD|nr:unnamed protein product [Timema podura]